MFDDITDGMNRLQRHLLCISAVAIVIALVAGLLQFFVGGLWFFLSGLGAGMALTGGYMSFRVNRENAKFLKSWLNSGI